MSNKEWNKAPEKNTSQWKKNESTIARNPFLRAERDKTQGFKPSSSIRVSDNSQEYQDGWERIFGKKNEKK
jgi:hypothetical protein